jgi:hypothetical protein
VSAAEPDAEFFGDVGCGWTWLASRWLVEVASLRSLHVRWRAFPLALLDDDHAAKPKYQQTLRAGRVVESLAAQRRPAADEAAGDFFSAYGTAVHVDRRHAGDDLALEAAVLADLDDVERRLDDDSFDAVLDEAQAIAGPGIGSPVIRIAGSARGFFGPVLTEPLHGAEALALWDALVLVAPIDGFSEVLRGRPDKPTMTASG